MNRRNFLRNSALLSTPMLFSGIPVFAGGGLSDPLLKALSKGTNACNKILVIIQMNGGNDGLNMVIPLDKYSQLSQVRSNLMIPAASVLTLTGSTTTGLHPSMTGVQDLYNNGKVSIVQGVSYPNPNYSHFQAQDIWFTAANSNQTLDTGWLGRELDTAYPNFPTGYPNTTDPDPLAIQIGGSLPLSLQGPSINMGYNAPNPASLLNVVNATSSPAPANDYGDELTFLRLMKDQSNSYTVRIKNAYNAQATQSTMYAASGNSLSDQLKIVARLIGGGLNTPVYVVNHPDSFDTHVNQVASSTSTTTGGHANSLSKLSVAIAAFQNDLTLMGKSNRVTGMTFSEFGRRVASNTSTGTDHGAAAPVIFFGEGVNGGIIGTTPAFTGAITTSTQVPTQYDFRQLYASVMQNWLCMDPTQSQTILNGNYNTVGVFRTTIPLPVSGIELKADWRGNFANLEFAVRGNDAADQFLIERSVDGKDFSIINSLNNYSGNVNETYTYRDERIRTDEVFYRVLCVTKQGESQYSNTVKLVSGAVVQVMRVYPNPVVNHVINIEFLQQVRDYVEIELYGPHGERLYYDQVLPNGNKIRVQVADMFVPNTLYVLKVKYGMTEAHEKIVFS